MGKWMLAHEAMLKSMMQRSLLARIVVRALLAYAIASAQHDEKKAERA